MQSLIIIATHCTHLHMYAYSEWHVEQGEMNWFRLQEQLKDVALCGPHSLIQKPVGGTHTGAVYPVKEKTTELGSF